MSHRTVIVPALALTGLLTALGFAPSGCGSPQMPELTPPPSAALSSAPSASAPSAVGSAAQASSAVPHPGSPPDANMERAQIPDRYKWNLAPLMESDEAFEKALQSTAQDRQKLGEFKGKLASPKALQECLSLYFRTRLQTNKLTLYSAMRFDSDQKSAQLQGMHTRALDAMNELMAKAAFIRSEVLALTDPALKRAYQTEPKLAEYRPYLEELRRRRGRVLSNDGEKVLSLMGDNLWAEIDLNELPSDYEKAANALLSDIALPQVHDEKGQPVQLTLSNYGKLRRSENRAVRKETVESFFGSLKAMQNSFASTLSGQVRFNIALARSRGYSTALEAYLDKDNINPAVYRNLVSAIHANLGPLQRYIKLRKQVMGVPELHIYDLYTPLVPSVQMQFPYEQARQVLPEALAPLGPEYLSTLRTGLDPASGWIDVYPHKNKESGAFSSSVFGVHPYVKMNYFNGLDDLSTLAHEYGHAMHSHLAMTQQPYVTSSYAPFIAEIASTFNEKMLSDYLLEHAKSDDEKLYILNELVDRIRTTIYRQTLFAEFELEAHTAAERGEPLTAEFFDKLYARLIKTYYGADLTVGANDDVEWAYIPHFYYKYYVYSYATGLSSGIALAQLVKEKGAPARDAYLGMLKGGSSRPPLELLKGAGVDLTQPHAIESAAKLMDQTLAQMEQLLAKKTR